MTTLTESFLAKPWYRETWPWLLMAGPCIAIVAGFFTLWLAIQSDDGLVADDYYKRGLAINQTLSRAARADQLALVAHVLFETGSTRVRVTVTGISGLPDALRLRLVHPTRAVADRVVELVAIAPGSFEGTLPGPVGGRRVLMLEDMARTWRLAGEAAGNEQGVELTPQ